MEKDYGKKIDIWSMGAIFAEMLTMKEDNELPYAKRKPFFPGRSCYPLSPDKKRKKNVDDKKKSKVSDEDQLNIIINKIGPLNEEDMAFLSASKQTHYLKQFDITHQSLTLEQYFPSADTHAIDLLKSMLQFNPYFRPSIEECLEHEYFDDIDKEEFDGEEIDPERIEVQYEDKPESELRRILDETFDHFNETRDRNFGV